MLRALLLSAAAVGLLAGGAEAAPPAVVVSIKPLHSLAARVMEGVGEPTLLVTGAASLHTYSLRPSQAAALESADLVVWVGPGLESFLAPALATLAADATLLEAFELEEVLLLAAREGGSWEGHDHAHDDGDHADDDHSDDDHDHDHDHEDAGHGHEDDHAEAEGHIDGHLWLDPRNAQVIAAAMAETLAGLDPENAQRYAENAAALTRDLAALDLELAEQLAPLAGRPYVVFHDAYQYLEVRYDLAALGSVTVSPENRPGAQRLGEIRAKILELDATCVFAEPQFEPALVETLVEGTGARIGVLDPEGAEVAPGPEGYATLMRNLARDLRACLLPQS